MEYVIIQEEWKVSLSFFVKNSSKEASADETVKKVKIPKKKVAMLLSYCGVGYQGMQM